MSKASSFSAVDSRSKKGASRPRADASDGSRDARPGRATLWSDTSRRTTDAIAPTVLATSLPACCLAHRATTDALYEIGPIGSIERDEFPRGGDSLLTNVCNERHVVSEISAICSAAALADLRRVPPQPVRDDVLPEFLDRSVVRLIRVEQRQTVSLENACAREHIADARPASVACVRRRVGAEIAQSPQVRRKVTVDDAMRDRIVELRSPKGILIEQFGQRLRERWHLGRIAVPQQAVHRLAE